MTLLKRILIGALSVLAYALPLSAVQAEDPPPDSVLECKDGETQIFYQENADISAFDPSQHEVTLQDETPIPDQNAIAYRYTPGMIRCFWIDLSGQ